MRTKTLVLTAALGVATIATSMAQVYSVNAVGYVKVSVPVGFSIIANPLDAGTGNNVLSKLFAAPSEGTTIYKFNSAAGSYDISTYSFGSWDTDRTMDPGQGAFILNADTKTFDVVFVGEVKQGHLVTTVPSGFSMIASQVPQAGGLTTDLKYTPADGDTVYAFNNAKGSYDIGTYSFGTWDTEPNLAVAQGFFINSTGASWARDFSVNN
jgi:hypothetical protein